MKYVISDLAGKILKSGFAGQAQAFFENENKPEQLIWVIRDFGFVDDVGLKVNVETKRLEKVADTVEGDGEGQPLELLSVLLARLEEENAAAD